MKYPVFAIRDAKVGFMAPTVEQNAPAAIRNFEHAVLNSASLMNSHPGDYDLYEIGSFDSDSAELEKTMPKHLISAAEVLR